MIVYRRMEISELPRIGEIDRSERVTEAYVVEDGSLREKSVDWDVPNWSKEGDGPHSVQANVAAWRPYLDEGGTMFGAFEHDRLIGFVIHRPELEPGTAQMAVLHVSCDRRGKGVGAELADKSVVLAERGGASRLYVSSTPSKATVDFYRGLGFELTHTPHPELLALEPEDVHMVMQL